MTDDQNIVESQEMLGKARELMDTYNDDYTTDERVVAVLIGADVSNHVEDVIAYGADVVVVREDAEVEAARSVAGRALSHGRIDREGAHVAIVPSRARHRNGARRRWARLGWRRRRRPRLS